MMRSNWKPFVLKKSLINFSKNKVCLIYLKNLKYIILNNFKFNVKIYIGNQFKIISNQKLKLFFSIGEFVFTKKKAKFIKKKKKN